MRNRPGRSRHHPGLFRSARLLCAFLGDDRTKRRRAEAPAHARVHAGSCAACAGGRNRIRIVCAIGVHRSGRSTAEPARKLTVGLRQITTGLPFACRVDR